MKALKIIIIILDVIALPLLLLQFIGGNYNFGGLAVMAASNIIIFTSKPKNKK